MSHSIAAHDSGRRTARTATKHTHPTRSGLSLTEVALLVILAVALVAAVLAVTTPATTTVPELTSVTVKSGQSLWELALEHPVPGLSTAQTVELITRTNALDSATVAAGTTLRVPAQTDSGALAMR